MTNGMRVSLKCSWVAGAWSSSKFQGSMGLHAACVIGQPVCAGATPVVYMALVHRDVEVAQLKAAAIHKGYVRAVINQPSQHRSSWVNVKRGRRF